MLVHRAAGRGWRLGRAPCGAWLSTFAAGGRAGLRPRAALAPSLQLQRSQLARALGAPPSLSARLASSGAPLRIGRALLRSRAGAPPGYLAVLAPKDAAETAAAAVGAKPADGAAAPTAKQKAWLVRTWEYIKHEAHHYYMGTVLLYKDVRTAVPLLQRLLVGHDLSRREHNLLVRVVADMTRLVPFAFFVIVPFMEFLLPFALRLFPGMLPSTYETKFKKEEDLKRKLKAKIELAKVMHEAVEEMAKDWQAKQTRLTGAGEGADGAADAERTEQERRVAEAVELRDLITKMRAGEVVETGAIIRFSRLFKDELTLGNLNRRQLELMCQSLGLFTVGGEPVLRFQLRNRIRKLKADDRMIVFEGVKTLSDDEVQAACADRGMRAIDLSPEAMRAQLVQWLELSQEQAVPITLLLLANGAGAAQPAQPSVVRSTISAVMGAVGVGGGAPKPKPAAEPAEAAAKAEAAKPPPPTDALAPAPAPAPRAAADEAPAPPDAAPISNNLESTLSALSDKLLDAAIASAASESKLKSGEELTAAEKLAALEREMKRIEDDRAREQVLAAASKAIEAAKAESKEALPADAPSLDPATPLADGATVGDAAAALVDGAAAAAPPSAPADGKSSSQLRALHDFVEAAEMLASESALAAEKEDLAELDALRKTAIRFGEAKLADKAISSLDARLEQMIAQLKKDVERVDRQIGDKLKVLDLDGDGIISEDELRVAVKSLNKGSEEAEQLWKEILDEVDPDHDGKIQKTQLRDILRQLEQRKHKEEADEHSAHDDDEPAAATATAAAAAAPKAADAAAPNA